MKRRRIVTLYSLALITVATFAAETNAQEQQRPGLTKAQQIQAQFNNGPGQQGPLVTPASLTTPAYALTRPAVKSADAQIRINIRFLSVDDETRKEIYTQIGESNIKTRTERVDESGFTAPLTTSGSELSAKSAVITSSIVSTCLLSDARVAELLQQVRTSKPSSFKAPSIILIDGNEGQLNDIVQRPFVVGLPSTKLEATQRSRSATTESQSSPDVQVLDEGTQLRVRVKLRGANRVHLASEVQYKRIKSFDVVPVFGIGKDAVLQVPQQQIHSAAAAEEMQFGQTLLVDPYVTQEVEFRKEQGVPIFNKIPYINRSFKNVAIAHQKVNLMVLLQPMVEE